ncbi:MAG: hypothetical protein ACON5F_07300 [Jejuia sp.]
MDKSLLKLKYFAKYFSLILLVISIVIFIIITFKINQNRSIPEITKERLKNEVIDETKILSKKLKALDSITHYLNSRLDEFFNDRKKLEQDTSNVRLMFENIFSKTQSDIFGIGLCLDPKKIFEYSPYWYRKNNKVQFHQLHDTIPNNNDRPYEYWKDIPDATWYHQLMSGENWVHPYFGRRAQDWLFEYGLPILRNCDNHNSNCDTIGIVYADYSPRIFQHLAQANTGNTSHDYIVTKENKVIYYDNQRLDLSNTLIDLKEQAKAQKDRNSLMDFCEKIVPINRDTSGIMTYGDATQAGNKEWRIYSKIKPTYWTYAFIYNTDQIDTKEGQYIKLKIFQIVLLLLLLSSLAYLFLNHFSFTTPFLKKYKLANNAWVFSKLVTLILAFGLIWILYVINDSWPNLYKIDNKNLESHAEGHTKIVNYEGTSKYLNSIGINDEILKRLGTDNFCSKDIIQPNENENELLTNIIQWSMSVNQIDLISANKIRVSGKILIKYPSRFNSLVCNGRYSEKCKPPFYFPNMTSEYSIEHLSTYRRIIPRKGRNQKKEYDVSNWYFNVILHQNLNYKNYPFDVLPLEIKIQPNFSNQELIIPDFDNYYLHAVNIYDNQSLERTEKEKMLSNILQGFSNDLKINEWDILEGSYRIRESTFPHTLKSCDSEIVFGPELFHSTLVKRELFEPLISNFLPIFVIAFIVFIIVLRLKTLGIEGVIGTTVGLFFSLLLSHYKLRDELQVNDVVYIEYYYFLLYIILISFLVNKYFHLSDKRYLIIDYKDNLLAKIIYWPFLLSVVILFTIVFFVSQV